MRTIGLRGVLRGKVIRTTVSRKTAAAAGLVNRQFVTERPNQLWCADFTYVSIWQGFAYVAFIIDVSAGTIVGWRVSSSMETRFVLDALEQALWARRPQVQSITRIRATNTCHWRTPSVCRKRRCSTGDSYDNALVKSINGLYKAEVIHRKSWKNLAEVELATLEWVDWFNNRRLLERLGHTPPVEAEKAYYASIGNKDLAARASGLKTRQRNRCDSVCRYAHAASAWRLACEHGSCHVFYGSLSASGVIRHGE